MGQINEQTGEGQVHRQSRLGPKNAQRSYFEKQNYPNVERLPSGSIFRRLFRTVKKEADGRGLAAH